MKLYKKIRTLFVLSKSNKYFSSSKKYWQNRYLSNENSGFGSYGNLSIFKAKVVNDFITKKNIRTIIDFGCGDGNQLKLAKYDNYIGIDVSDKAIEICKKMYNGDNSKKFYTYNKYLEQNYQAELSLSLDVIFHLLENDIFSDYMYNLFSASTKYVIIYSSNYDKYIAKHVRCRKFTDWIDVNLKDEFKQIDFIKNIYPFNENDPKGTSMSDFFIYKRIY
ncbi:methyltransferase domain-containing protein [Lutibacter sp.]|uniref:methyltransferase domain-containing protein n=1 Tax=Lutibacter sp. TaxID=1925666 RepID=UPI0025BC3557|nr:methyltransferase domain-containing protein [Lutibacter sp.]MCF6182625.1 class I SAM-dependent methyltransferase [Lutibacter sp.]